MQNKLKTLSAEEDLRGKRVLMRVDANIDSNDIDSLRISRLKKDIIDLTERGAQLILLTHRGKPRGREETLSTEHLIPIFKKIIGLDFIFTNSFKVSKIDKLFKEKPDSVILLENTRFESGEVKNSRIFAKKLAKLADIYINNAFGASHRKHASIHRITSYLPSFAGQALQLEFETLSKKIDTPFILIVGGLKLTTKIPLINTLASQAEVIILGSGYANVWRTLRLGQGSTSFPISKSEVKAMKKLLKDFEHKVILPKDLRVENRQGDEEIVIRTLDQLQPDDFIIDIGPDTELLLADYIDSAKTIIWNGPLGIVEHQEGKDGTLSLIDQLLSARLKKSIIGGGDTIKLLTPEEINSLYFVSTGGGAMLSFLAGEKMPGLDMLK